MTQNKINVYPVSTFFAQALGLYALLAGIITLIGWILGIPRLTDWIHSGIAMFVNTAVLSICGGAALLLHLHGRRGSSRLGAFLGTILMLFAAAILFQHVTGINLGIDTFLIQKPWGHRAAMAPGRTGPPASIAFTLLGLAFMFAAGGPKFRRLVPFIGIFTAAISMLSLMGYLFEADRLFSMARFTGIALQTATIIFALGIGLVLSISEHQPLKLILEKDSAGLLARRALPAVTLLPIVLGWLCVQGRQAGFFDMGMGFAVLVLSLIGLFCFLLWQSILSVHRHEEKLRASEQRFRHFISLMPAAVYTCDMEGRITFFNRRAAELWGREPRLGDKDQKFCGAFRLRLMDGTILPHAGTPMAEAVRNGTPARNREVMIERPDGTSIVVAVNIDALYDNQSHRIGAINVFQDVTEQKKSEKNLENVNRQLKELTQDLEQRVRERTHQLEEQSEQLRRLALELTEAEERERKRLAEILHDHLQQLLIAAKMRLTWSRGAITEKAVEEAQSFLEQAYEASRSLTAELRPPVLYEGGLNASLRFLTRKFQDQYGFKVTLSFNTNAEPFSNDAKTMIYQSVQELLINAVKYSGVKECSLAVERLPKGNLRVLVEDQGVGFDVKNIGKKGSEGFGLFSIRERVKALGGDCQISSQAGRGTSFEIRIPDPAPAGEDHFAEIAEDDSAAFPAHKREEALRVLLADDHKIVRQSLAQLLGSQPFIHQVLEAEDGKDAVEKARAFQPDVVIMDLNMPKMNGIEATKMLHETHPQIKIIGLSVQIEPETAQAMKDAGAVAYFSKSQDINSLIDALQAFAAAKTAAVIPLS